MDLQTVAQPSVQQESRGRYKNARLYETCPPIPVMLNSRYAAGIQGDMILMSHAPHRSWPPFR